MLRRCRLVLTATAALGACGSLATERAAVIAAPTAGTRAELARVVTLALAGSPATLAPDALTREPMLVVEHREPANLQGRVATGRTLSAAERFRLVLRGARCELVRESDGRRFPLREVECVPVGAR